MGSTEQRSEAWRRAAKTIKRELRRWGSAPYVCRQMEKEIKKLERTKKIQQARMERTESPEKKKIIREILVLLDGQTEESRGQLERERQEAEKTETALALLTDEERRFLLERFRKGNGFDCISLHMHISRSGCFRMQNRILIRLYTERKKAEGHDGEKKDRGERRCV